MVKPISDWLLRRRAVVGPINVRIGGIANLSAFLITHVVVMVISRMAVKEGEVCPGGMA